MKNLKEKRLAKGYTQTSLARAMNVSITTIQRWEQEAMKPSPENLKKLCDLLED